MFFKIGVHKNFIIFTGKHLCLGLFLIKLKDTLKAFYDFKNNQKVYEVMFFSSESVFNTLYI